MLEPIFFIFGHYLGIMDGIRKTDLKCQSCGYFHLYFDYRAGLYFCKYCGWFEE